MRRGTVQVKKSAADDLRVCPEKSPNIAFERDAANSAAPLNLYVYVKKKAKKDKQTFRHLKRHDRGENVMGFI
jgi:hypothetical protein